MQLREPRDERETHPDAGGVCRRVGPLAEGLEDLLADLGGDAGAVVLDGDERPVVLGVDAHPHGGVPRGVPRGVR